MSEPQQATLAQMAAKFLRAVQAGNRVSVETVNALGEYDVAIFSPAVVAEVVRADVQAAIRETWEEAAKVADFFQDEAEQKKDQFLGGSNPWNGYRIAAGHYSNVAAAIRARSDAEGERP